MWRAFDVDAVVDALHDLQATVVAGGAGRHRQVSKACLVDDPVRLANARPEELVVTTTAILRAADPGGADMLGTLAAGRVAGLALRVRPSEPVLPETLNVADDLGFPVIVFPEPVSSADVITAVLDALIEALSQDRFAATSLEELIAGHGGSGTDAVERAISFGWDLLRPRSVLLASVDPPVDPAALPAALTTIAAAARATLGRDAIVWPRSTTIAALLAPATDEGTERRTLADALRVELDRRLHSVTVSIGVGRNVHEPAQLPQSYVEAKRAVDVGRWAKGRHVTEVFDQLGLERVLASTPGDDLTGFVGQAVGSLLEHDRRHRTDLLETLGAWLETRNMAEAARRVHVHYNTLKNRLDRIEQILGSVLTDPGRALECEVAIYIVRNYDGPWSASSA